jgi:transcriptional regulator with XRE-family HTH domain
MTDWMAVGQRIRAARAAKGLTGLQLGVAAGIGDAARVSALESGAKPLTEENLAKVAAVLGVSMPWLRYGVATGLDERALKEQGYAVGWRDALEELDTIIGTLRAADPGARLSAALGDAREAEIHAEAEAERPAVARQRTSRSPARRARGE